MSETKKFTIGCEVLCTDGPCGKLALVVVDPLARTLTHLVVEPGHRHGPARLVPVELVDTAAADEAVALRCTREHFETLDPAEETRFLSADEDNGVYEQDQIRLLPYYGLGPGALGRFGGGMGPGSEPSEVGPRLVTRDRVPLGEVEVRRGERVHATDGDIGRVRGLIVDPADRHVTHVLLDEGHLWGKKRVAIPIAAVTGVSDGVRLSLSKDEVRDLPPVELEGDQDDGPQV